MMKLSRADLANARGTESLRSLWELYGAVLMNFPPSFLFQRTDKIGQP